MGRGASYDFYSFDIKLIDSWMAALTKHCVKVDIYKDYIRKDRMGKGNFATVYSWMKKSNNVKYAVKSIHKKKILESKKKKDINPLLSEIEIMRVLDHKGVIKLYEIYEEETIVHLVLDLLEGGELFERIK
jgi:calcium/calmodulin-dependent protein kinase I